MGWIYLAESVDSPYPWLPGCGRSPIVKTSPTLRLCSCHECDLDLCPRLPFGMMFAPCKKRSLKLESRLFTAGFRARISALREMAQAWKEKEAGLLVRYSASLMNCRQRSSFSKMCRRLGRVEQNEWLKSWPVVGMTVAGTLYPLPKWERPTSENVGFCLLPTPSASSYGSNKGGAAGRVGTAWPSLETMARHNLWPTPTASDAAHGGPGRRYGNGDKTLSALAAALSPKKGSLNPQFVEWLMGYPKDWTKLSPETEAWLKESGNRNGKALKE